MQFAKRVYDFMYLKRRTKAPVKTATTAMLAANLMLPRLYHLMAFGIKKTGIAIKEKVTRSLARV